MEKLCRETGFMYDQQQFKHYVELGIFQNRKLRNLPNRQNLLKTITERTRKIKNMKEMM